MSQPFRAWKVWLLSAVCVGVVVWLATQSWTEVGRFQRLAAQGRPDQARHTIMIDRAPLRFIKDPYPSFSAVAVNSDNNMLVVTDENLFQILEYDSRANTPPTARFTEPKRIISGTNTHAEMMCGVYIDPEDARDLSSSTMIRRHWMPVFSPDARGNAKPNRSWPVLRGFAMAAHEERQELFITNQERNPSMFSASRPKGKKSRFGSCEGSDTQLEDPHGVAIDTKNNLLFVSNYGNAKATEAPAPGSPAGSRPRSYGKFEPPSITVYPLNGVRKYKTSLDHRRSRGR